jgi:hypothetical protein
MSLLQRWLLLATTASALTGCAFERPRTTSPVEPFSSCAQALRGERCAPADPAILPLARSLASVDRGEGWYAREVLAAAAAKRDALIVRILDRAERAHACEPDPDRRRGSDALDAQLVAALAAGRDPFDWRHRIEVVDLTFTPRAFPFASRVCDGTGFEGAMACVAYGPIVSLVDLASFPLGTWIWAAEEEHTWVSLADVPPSPAVRADVAARLPGGLAKPPGACPSSTFRLPPPPPLIFAPPVATPSFAAPQVDAPQPDAPPFVEHEGIR